MEHPDALQLERAGVPSCFPGLVAHWPAVQLWRDASGLQRLIELAGDARVEAMVSAGDRLVGDMQHLLLLGCSLREFLDGSLEAQLAQRQPPGTGPLRLYLAQSPLCAAAPPGQPPRESAAGAVGGGGACAGTLACLQAGPLQPLLEDLGVPSLVQGVQLSQVNFWASMRATRSSLHYDPYCNLLCVLAGSKLVWLAPPCATPCLSPQPLTSESANHAADDLARPDLQAFPRLADALPLRRVHQLGPGDALFIPEGWWHQVDSTDGTLAVNFWWEGEVARRLGGPDDCYLLRRALQSLVEQRKAAQLAALPRADLAAAAQQQQQQQGGGGVCLQQDATASAAAQPALGASEVQLPAEEAAAVAMLAAALASHQQAGESGSAAADVTAVVAALADRSPQALLDALLHLRRTHPPLAAHLLLRALDPPGWELLSVSLERRQEELAAQGGPEAAADAVGAVCDELYAGLDGDVLLQAILHRKQEFARGALQAVLEEELAGCL